MGLEVVEVELADCCSFWLASSGCLGTVFWSTAGLTDPLLSAMSGGRMEMKVVEEGEQGKEAGFWDFQAWPLLSCPQWT